MTARPVTRSQLRQRHELAAIDTNGHAALGKRDASKLDRPSADGVLSIRTLALAALTIQNASVSLLTRMSRLPRHPGASVYNPAVAVFTAELVKLSVSMTMLIREHKRIERKEHGKRKPRGTLKIVRHAVWDLAVRQKHDVIKLAVPAALYATQNTLLYLALSNLDAATYQTTYQLKLLTTALFSLLFFKRRLSWLKWFSLFLLTIGVAIVQLDGTPSSNQSSNSSKAHQDRRLGFAAILAACISSGLAGGWFEWVLKSPAPPPASTAQTPTMSQTMSAHGTVSPTGSGSPSTPASAAPVLREGSPSLWARNIQLSIPSLVFSLSGVLLSPQLGSYHPSDIWLGFTPLVWSVVLNQALGGLLVAMVVRYADSVAKGFATSLAIVLSTLSSVVLFGLVPGTSFLLGASLVILSTIIYAVDKS
ncbi:hypothetical protein OIV83_001172 [Microbotryomycetes sp. JL201]|nr:hypothetical protein OIV83_001172 [Microbotryomycetes sp. JL201]